MRRYRRHCSRKGARETEERNNRLKERKRGTIFQGDHCHDTRTLPSFFWHLPNHCRLLPNLLSLVLFELNTTHTPPKNRVIAILSWCQFLSLIYPLWIMHPWIKAHSVSLSIYHFVPCYWNIITTMPRLTISATFSSKPFIEEYVLFVGRIILIVFIVARSSSNSDTKVALDKVNKGWAHCQLL